MHIRAVVVAAALGLFCTQPCSADVIGIDVMESDGAGNFVRFVFGPTGAFVEAPFETVTLNGVAVVPPGPHGIAISGLMQLMTGPLLSLSVTPVTALGRTESRYEFAAGQVSLVAQWSGLQGETVTGHFVAAVPGMTIELCEQQLSDPDACGDVFGDSQGFATATLGAGVFDPVFAAVLGITGVSTGGSLAAAIDGVTDNPSSDGRVAGFAAGSAPLRIDGVSIPEPSLTALLTMAAAGLFTARRRRKTAAARSRPLSHR